MNKHRDTAISRRAALCMTTSAAAAVAFVRPAGAAVRGPAATKGRINQSIAFWCFNQNGDMWDIEKTCQVAKNLGCKSVELCGPEDFPVLKKHGLTCAIAHNGMPGTPFVKGLNNLKYHAEIIGRTKQSMDTCAEFGMPNVIAFNGYKYRDAEDPNSGEISLEEGARNCVRGLKELARHAERKNVTVCIEMLNTRDDTHPMKGHPGYQGNDLDYVFDIVKQVSSPRVKLLFDVYHVQVMNGDVIRRIGECGEHIGHVHTAGNPGRGEIDLSQELNYAAIMKKLLQVGYSGYVGHEFIPTRDPYQGLYEAVKLCDV